MSHYRFPITNQQTKFKNKETYREKITGKDENKIHNTVTSNPFILQYVHQYIVICTKRVLGIVY